MTSDMLTLIGLLTLIGVVLRVLRADGVLGRRAERRRSVRRLSLCPDGRGSVGERRRPRRVDRAPVRPGHGPKPMAERRDGGDRRVSGQPVAVEYRLGLERRQDWVGG